MGAMLFIDNGKLTESIINFYKNNRSMEPVSRPIKNIGQALSENFKEEMTKFLEAQLRFKSGNIFYGQVAVSILTSMFYLLPAGRLIAKDEERAKEFVNSMDALRVELQQYALARDNSITEEKFYPLNESYMELDNKFDALVRNFYKIMFEVGFSP